MLAGRHAFDLTGKVFGKLTVISKHSTIKRCTRWKCKCECGNEAIVLGESLKSGATKSCGCYRKEITKIKATTHGLSKDKLYDIWCDMKRRCYNPKNKRYENYGGRNIKVCEEWHEFKPFYDWALNNGYIEGLTIDRINNNGDYEPDNCRWATAIVQMNNTTRNHFVEFKGQIKTISQWSKITGISQDVIKDRLTKLGWSAERALTVPVRRCLRHGN